MSTDPTLVRELWTSPILTHPANGGAVMDTPHTRSRYSTRVEVVPIGDARPLVRFDRQDHDAHTREIGGGIVGETIDERARRERREHVVNVAIWTGALIGCGIFWYAVAMIVAGLVR